MCKRGIERTEANMETKTKGEKANWLYPLILLCSSKALILSEILKLIDYQ